MTSPPDRIDLGEIDVSEIVQALTPEGTETVTVEPVTDPAEIAAVFTTSIEAGQLRHPFDSPLGSITDGGLAEAGYQPIGYIVGDGPTITPED